MELDGDFVYTMGCPKDKSAIIKLSVEVTTTKLSLLYLGQNSLEKTIVAGKVEGSKAHLLECRQKGTIQNGNL